MKKPKKRLWQVSGYGGIRSRYWARYPRSAASQFFKRWQKQLQSDGLKVRGFSDLSITLLDARR